MKQLNVLISGGGSPGIAGTIYSLRNNYENRKINIVTVDMKDNVIGKYLADKFYTVPKSTEKTHYIASISKICKSERIDVLVPQNTSELLLLSQELDLFNRIGTKVIVSDYDQMKIANNKYELLKLCSKINVPFPNFNLVDNFKDLREVSILLGYPTNPVIIKPPDSNGSRGIRVIDENKNYKNLYYNEKPTNLFIKLNQLYEVLGDKFQPLLVMEYLPGDEVTIDVFNDDNVFISIPRKRDEVRSGISFINSAFNSQILIDYSKIITKKLKLKYCFGFQFKYDSKGIPKILECNPRVQGTMVFSTFMGANLIYLAIKSALGESLPSVHLDWNTKLVRYWGAIGIVGGKTLRV